MQRTATGLCIAAVLGLVAGAAAQQTTTPQSGTRTNTQTAVTSNDMRDVAITGCLQRGTHGNFMLTSVQM